MYGLTFSLERNNCLRLLVRQTTNKREIFLTTDEA